MRAVRIGGPVALAIIGLILALAISESIQGINLTMIGWILFGAAVVWLALELILNRPRAQVTEVRESHGPDGDVLRREDRRGY